MTKQSLQQFDTNAANNTDIDGISVAVGWPPQNVGSAFRELMALLANFSQPLVIALTTTTVTLTPQQGSATLQNYQGSPGGSTVVTVPQAPAIFWAVNGTSDSSAVQLTTGVSGKSNVTLPTLDRGWSLVAVNAAGDVSILQLSVGPFVQVAVVGEVKALAHNSVPSGWLYCYGQAVSRTTYSALFTALGTTYGVGDGTTTFNLPDYRGRLLAGRDDMGGTNANRLSTVITGSNTLGQYGGDQNLQAHDHGVSDPGHAHAVGDPSHHHGGPSGRDFVTYVGTGGPLGTGTTNSAIQHDSATADATTNITITAANTGVSVDTNGTGSQENVQPTAITNYIIFAAA